MWFTKACTIQYCLPMKSHCYTDAIKKKEFIHLIRLAKTRKLNVVQGEEDLEKGVLCYPV